MMLSTGNQIVDAVGQLGFEGNIIPHAWYSTIKKDTGKAYLNAIVILSDIVYWYRPSEKRDEGTGMVLRYEKKFKSDLLQRSYQQMADLFGISKRDATNAVVFLEKLGIVKRHFRTLTIGGTVSSNVLFIELIPSALAKYTYPAQTVATTAVGDTYHSNGGHPLTEISDTPLLNGGQLYTQSGGTYTENTTKINKEITNKEEKERKKEAVAGDEPYPQFQGTEKGTKKEPNARKASGSNNIRSYEVIITDYTTNSDLVQALWDFIAMRKMKKNPPTDRALRTVLNKLDELSNNDDAMKIKLLDNAIEKGWLTIYPLKQEGGNNSGINGRNHAENSIPAWAKNSFI